MAVVEAEVDVEEFGGKTDVRVVLRKLLWLFVCDRMIQLMDQEKTDFSLLHRLLLCFHGANFLVDPVQQMRSQLLYSLQIEVEHLEHFPILRVCSLLIVRLDFHFTPARECVPLDYCL